MNFGHQSPFYGTLNVLKLNHKRKKRRIDVGLFGDLFDFNGDGRLDSLESAIEFNAFMNLLDAEEEGNNGDDTDEEF